MTINFDPLSGAPAARGPVEPNSPAPVSLGVGDGASTLQSMASAQDSKSCLWEMLSFIWNWIRDLCGCPSAEYLQETFQEKAAEIVTHHFSVWDVHLPQWKAGIVITLDGQNFFQCGDLTHENKSIFRDQAIQIIKDQIEHAELTSDSKLKIELFFMTTTDEKNTFHRSSGSVTKDRFPYKEEVGVNLGLTNEETAEYLDEYPVEFQRFFLNPQP